MFWIKINIVENKIHTFNNSEREMERKSVRERERERQIDRQIDRERKREKERERERERDWSFMLRIFYGGENNII